MKCKNKLHPVSINVANIKDQPAFIVRVSSNELYRTYIENLAPEIERCPACELFVRSIGGLVYTTPEGVKRSIWQIKTPIKGYEKAFDALATLVLSTCISHSFTMMESLPVSPPIRSAYSSAPSLFHKQA